ncbi:hypothetical protein DYI25_14380 [Mesobacillus boroniphilus]|uniref:Uncharacterized protein n=1 Tax=Mesobacillus boroniphilus TaxID=308892 RepID=A0A944GXC1_9BACI|nr:hypothetical protein [Mesobacillus boroniphilus]MBS8265612.1 hypothetical protein [Mesobacillus boroniphilus]
MKRVFLIVCIAAAAGFSVFIGYEQMLEAKEREKDLEHITYLPVVTVGDQKLKLYEYGQCKEESGEEEETEFGPSSCENVTEEEALEGKTAAVFEIGSELTIKKIMPSGELEFKEGPARGVRRTVSGGYTKDGKSLGPADIKLIYKDLENEYLETVILPKEPGYFVGRIDLGTPSGHKNYVFHFNYN